MITTNPLASLMLAPVALIAATALLWPLRRMHSWRRTIISLWLGVPALWLWMALQRGYLVLPRGGSDGAAKLITAAAILLVVNAGLQLAELLLWEVLVERRRQRTISRLLVNLFNALILSVTVLAILQQIYQVDITALLVTSTVIAAIIGLALQDMLRSVIAGLALQVESPFQLGDWVRVGEHEGEVMQMNWRTLILRTRANNYIVLPNHQVANEYLINYSRPSPLQAIDILVGVAEAHAPGPTKAALADSAATARGVCTDPQPYVYVEEYGDSTITYRVRFWITDYAEAQRIRDTVMTNVWYRLRRAGMAMPVLTRDVTVRTLPEDHRERWRETEQRTVFAILRRLDLLAPLTDVQIEHIAVLTVRQQYTGGEPLVRQGDPGDSLFVIQAGRVRVEVHDEHGRAIPVATRGPDEFFGEMSLLTGAPRSATVVAEGETEVVVVNRDAVAAILLADPTIAERLSETLAARLIETRQQLAAAGPVETPTSLGAEILHRIRAFFGLEG